MRFFKVLFLVFLYFYLVGCQSSQLNSAGEEHKTVAEKWYALANYAKSGVLQYGVTVTAQLHVEVKNQQQIFKLTNFKFNQKESRQDINLLAPSFTHKYICSPVCYQLLEYVNASGHDGATLLSNYFSKHEFELFKFYGDMSILNDPLSKLADKNRSLLISYLHALSVQDLSFNSSKEFNVFLAEAFTLESFERYIEDPSALENYVASPPVFSSEFLKNHLITPDDQWSEGLNEGISDGLNKEQNDWLVDALSPELLIDTYLPLPLDTWLTAGVVDGVEYFQQQSTDENILSWQAAKAVPLIIGQNVCSYQDGFFGVVSSVEQGKVSVDLLGQAKLVQDGAIYPVGKGALFNSNSELYFLPEQGNKTFTKTDVATCYFE